MLWSGGVRRDIGQVYVCGCYSGKLYFCFFRRFFQPLKGHLVLGKVNSRILFKFIGKIFYNAFVKVVAAQLVISRCCQHLYDAVADFQNRNVKGSAAKVINQYFLVGLLVQAVCQGCRCGLVYYTQYFQSGNPARILCGLTLTIGKVGRNGDYGLSYLLAQIAFRVAFQLLQHHCRNLWRTVFFIVNGYLIIRAHFSFYRAYGPVRICDGLAFSHLSYHSLTGL